MFSNAHYKSKPIKYKKFISCTFKKILNCHFYKNYIYIYIYTCFVYSIEKLINIENRTNNNNKQTKKPVMTSTKL